METSLFKTEKKQEKGTKKKFIVFTSDASGLPFALRMQDEGSEVYLAFMDWKMAHNGEEKTFENDEEKQEFEEEEKVRLSYGDGLIPKMDAEKVMKNRAKLKDAYFIFDMCGGKVSDILRREGFKVFAGSDLGYKLENDRKFGMSFMEQNYKINPPEEVEYGTGQADKAISDIESNEEKAWVFKPDKVLTVFLPRQSTIEMARKELISFLRANRDKVNQTSFILQEKIYGMELAVEVNYSKGKPIFATIDLESKRKFGDEQGPLCGCSFDLVFKIPLDSPIVKIACEPFYGFAKRMNYTGPMDLNIIFKDKKHYYGLEFCGTRMGYNATLNFFQTLKMPISEYFAGMMDGTFKNEDDIETDNYGASVTIFNMNVEKGGVGYEVIDKKRLWIADAKMEDGEMVTCGGDDVLAYYAAPGPTPEECIEEMYWEIEEDFLCPNIYFRHDLEKDKYPNPIYRLKILKAMDLW